MQRHAAPEMNLQAAVRMAQTTNPSRGSCHEQLLALTPGGERPASVGDNAALVRWMEEAGAASTRAAPRVRCE
jgi:hypothetical protein